MAPPIVHAIRPLVSAIVTFWFGMPRPATATHQVVDRPRALRSGDVGRQRVRIVRHPALRVLAAARVLPDDRSPDRPANRDRLRRRRPWRRWFRRRPRTASARPASGSCVGSRGSGSMRTRSLQSPPLLVNPHATWPLLPTTRPGMPGSVTPVMRWLVDGLDGIGKHHRRAIPDDRHADRQVHVVGDERAPDALCAPSTAQLLLPMMADFVSRGHGDTHDRRR